MRSQLNENYRTHRPAPEIVAAGDEWLSSQPEASVDAVVAMLVLCSVPDLARTTREIRRVLQPGGRLVIVEHVQASGWSRAPDAG